MPGRFPLGRLVMTTHARGLLNSIDVSRCLIRHMNGDWGNLCKEDKAENEFSVTNGFRILSSYEDRNKIQFWIVTEADRSATTILLPEDY